MSLTVREVRAINGIMKGWTQEKALLEAGYSPSVSRTRPQDVFNKYEVKREINRRKGLMVERNKIDEDWIVQRLMTIADATVGDLIVIDEDGSPRVDYGKLTPQMRYALASMQTEEFTEGRGKNAVKGQRIKIKTDDKLRALEMLGKFLGMFKERVTVDAEQAVIDALRSGRSRVAKSGINDDEPTED